MTTEERIAQIAQGFGQGIQNFQAGQERQRAKELQDEARLRQEALQAIETSNALSTQYNKMIDPAAIQGYLKTGDLQGIGQLLESSPGKELDNARKLQALDLELKQAQIDELNKPFYQRPEAEKMRLASQLGSAADIKKMAYEAQLKKAQEGGQAGLPKLGAEEKKAVGGIASGLRSLRQMEVALNKGFGPRYVDPETPLLGRFVSDDPFTKEQRVLTDVVGRLQSGGAINNDEGERFKSMGPRPGDSEEIKRSKLKDQQIFLENKLLAMGARPEQLSAMGFDVGQSIDTNPSQPRQRITNKTGVNYSSPNIPTPQPFQNAMASSPEQAVQTIKSMTPEQKMQYAKQRGLIP